MPKKQKAPKLFPPTIPRKRFEQRILKRVAVQDEKRFLSDLYRPTPGEEVYRRDQELDQAQVRKLKKIAKAVRHNRGFLQPVKVGLLAVVAGIAAIVILFFADRMIEQGATAGLESLFGARVELGDLRIRPLQPGFSFESLEVADRHEPYRNLFELGRTEVRLDLAQLFRGKLVARTVETHELRWDTERETSGRLPADRRPEAEERVDADALRPPELDQLVAERFADIDPREFVEKHFQQLATPGRLMELMEAAERDIEHYAGRAQEAESRVRSLSNEAEAILAIDPSELRSIDSVRNAYETVNSAYTEADETVAEIRATRDRVESDYERYQGELREIPDLVTEDAGYLRELVPEFDLADASAVGALVLPELYHPLNERYRRARTIWDAIERLRDDGDDPDVEDATRRSGRTVEFPEHSYPGILFEHVALSVGERAAHDLQELRIRAVSSNPQLVGEPTTLTFSHLDGSRELDLRAVLDMRSGRAAGMEMDLGMRGYEFQIGNRSGIIPFSNAAGTYHLEGDLPLRRAGSPSGSLKLRFDQLVLDVVEDNRVAILARDVVDSVPHVDLDLRFTPEGEVTMHSNLDGPLQDELYRFLQERRAEVQERVTAEVERRLEQELARYEEEIAQLETYYEDLRSYAERARNYRQEIDRLEDRLANRADNLRAELEERAREAADEARREAEERAREAADDARREAEERARDEIEDRFDGIRDRFP